MMSAYQKLLKAINDAIDKLDGHIDEIKARDALMDQRVETLQRAVPLLRQLIRHEQTMKRRRAANTEKLLKKLANLGESNE